MADLTASQAVKNDGVSLTLNDATASQTINMADAADDRMVILVENENDEAMTATIQVAPGGFYGNVLGTLTEEVAPGAAAIIGPLEGIQFKGTDSKITVGVSVTASGTISNVKIGVIKLP